MLILKTASNSDTLTVFLTVAAAIALLVWPIAFCVKFKKKHDIVPISGTGVILQLAAAAAFIYEGLNNEDISLLAWAILAVAFIVGIVLNVLKVRKSSSKITDIISGVYSQICCPVYIIFAVYQLFIKKRRR